MKVERLEEYKPLLQQLRFLISKRDRGEITVKEFKKMTRSAKKNWKKEIKK